jgi:transcriptional regulator with XRE-family HTH domain
MASPESPAVARRRLRLALRRAREAADLTQTEVAEALEWSLSKVQRIEAGDVTISHTDLGALLRHLGVTDDEAVSDLTETARASRRRSWWDEPRWRDRITPGMRQLFQFEVEARAIRVFQPALIPGILQTWDYARSVIGVWEEDDVPRDVQEVRLEIRMRRRQDVLERSDPPAYLLLLDESVIARQVGGPRRLADQLKHLASAATEMITLRIVPYDAPPLAMPAPFTLVDTGDGEDALLYREVAWADDFTQNRDLIRRHRRVFNRMWERAMSPEDSLRLVEARVEALLNSIDGASA